MDHRIAMIPTGTDIVENVAHWDGEQAWEPAGYDLIDVTEKPEVGAGWIYDRGSAQFLPF
jgi:hypothetical protein